ncbi:MAG: ribonucleoside triphosphate reductase, partial [Patescibacteria group bacterium]
EKTQSKAPKHFRTALGQVVNFFYTMQGEAAGAQAFANFDTYLAPFIRYDKLNFKEAKQCIQEFVFNVNVPTRVGFQTPFTNITLDVTPSKMIGEENIIIGGEVMPEKYKDFQPEMDMFNQALAEVMLAGDSTGRVFSFPIPTYNIDKNFDWDRESLKPMWEMTAKYGVPYFSNFVNSDMDRDDARSMCCRLRLDNRELRKRGGGLFGANPLTGSLGVVTINLARLGYLSKDKEEFKNRLLALMDLAKDSLEIKRKVIEKFTDDGLYPYSKHYLDNIYARFGSYWKNHFNTIGINGMNEATINLLGQDITTPEGHAFAAEMLDFMREKLMDYQNETNNLYNLEATPGEGCTYRFAKKDLEMYPEIIFANDQAVKHEGADPYYTNSSNLPVGFTDDLFSALDLQDDLQTKYTGGTVLHGYIGERISDPEVAKSLVKKIIYGYRLPYFTITPTFSICPVHGYLPGEHKYCPKCDESLGFNANSAKEGEND